jgi:uncharacterized protein YyaL (SSP411 family)
MKDDYDGAEPSGNSIAALALLRLSRLTHDEALRESAERTLQAFSQRLSGAPSAVPQMLAAYLYSTDLPRQVVVAGPPDNELLKYARRRFLPEWEVIPAKPDARTLMPELAEMRPVNGKAAAYVCENFACQLPVTEVDRLGELLR